MIKYFLTLVASSASVAVLFLATNFSWVHPVSSLSVVNKSVITVKSINLNLASSNLGLTDSQPHILDANLGCSCSVCLKFS